MQERRQDRRVSTILDASWHAQSGAAACRVTDLSPSGCFVEAVHPPAVNDEASVTLALGDESVRFSGNVRYVEPRMGFGMKFDDVSDGQVAAMEPVLKK